MIEVLNQLGLSVPVVRIGWPQTSLPSVGKVDQLRALANGLTAEAARAQLQPWLCQD